MTARVLIVNHAHSQICGVHDIGLRLADCLRHSTELDINHLDIGDANGWRNALAITEPDVVIVNYRPDLMPWVHGVLAATHQPTFAVLHQYEESTADARAMAVLAEGFDHVLALDPLLRPTDPCVHAVGRPIPETVEHTYGQTLIPQIGSFGFAFPHKGFHHVATEMTALDANINATYNLHMPEAYFNGANGASLFTPAILDLIRTEFYSRPRFILNHTADHLAERELVNRLAMNDVNCLLYHPGQPDAGMSSALDYLIAARRPMLLSKADMFRHAMYLHDGLPGGECVGAAHWPGNRLGNVLDDYDHWQECADDLYTWHHGRLVADIEYIVGAL